MLSFGMEWSKRNKAHIKTAPLMLVGQVETTVLIRPDAVRNNPSNILAVLVESFTPGLEESKGWERRPSNERVSRQFRS